MDLNFLVFPKPNFTYACDIFYSRLLLVPKRTITISNIMIKKAIRMNSSLTNNIDQNEGLNPDMEGIPLIPKTMQRKAPSLLKERNICSPMFGKLHTPLKQVRKPTMDTEATSLLHRRLFEGSGILQTDNPTPTNIQNNYQSVADSRKSISKNGFDIRKLKIKTSRFTSGEYSKPIKSKVTLSKLMGDLDSYRKNKESGLNLISQLDKRFSSKKTPKASLTEPSNNHISATILDDELVAPAERPTHENTGSIHRDNLNSDSHQSIIAQGLTRCMQNRSLQQVNEKFAKRQNTQAATVRSPLIQNTNVVLSKDARNSLSKSLQILDPLEELHPNQKPEDVMAQYNHGGKFKSINRMLSQKVSLNNKSPDLSQRLDFKADFNLAVKPESRSTVCSAMRNKNLIDNRLSESDCIPCLMLPPDFPSDSVIVYFHSNGEDIQQCQLLCELLRSSFNVVVINLVLDRGYGVSWI